MIAIDTSAIMAILLNEPEADTCIAAIEAEKDIVMSSSTLAETLIVAGRSNIGAEAISLIDGLGLEVVSVTPTWRSALRMPMQEYILHSSHHDKEPSEDGDGGNAVSYDGRIAPLPGGRIAVEYKGKPAGRLIYELKGNAYRPVRGQNERSGC